MMAKSIDGGGTVADQQTVDLLKVQKTLALADYSVVRFFFLYLLCTIYYILYTVYYILDKLYFMYFVLYII